MVVNKNYNNGIVSSISLISNDLKIDIYNAGSDLYWVLDKYKDDNEIKVCNDCEFYNRLDRLFNDIKECDNQYDKIAESYGSGHDIGLGTLMYMFKEAKRV